MPRPKGSKNKKKKKKVGRPPKVKRKVGRPPKKKKVGRPAKVKTVARRVGTEVRKGEEEVYRNPTPQPQVVTRTSTLVKLLLSTIIVGLLALTAFVTFDNYKKTQAIDNISNALTYQYRGQHQQLREMMITDPITKRVKFDFNQ